MEEEGQPLRLVRCPKCENVLPELVEYSVYQCGGCGAVLRGTQSTPASEKRSLENSDSENGTRAEPSTKEEVSLVSSSQVNTESDEFEVGRRKGKIVHEKVPNLTPSSSSRNEKHEIFTDSDQSRRRRLDFGPIRSTPVGFHRTGSTAEKGRFGNVLGNLPYSNEGPSSSHLSSFNSFGDHVTKVRDLENNNFDLLKKVDELRAQISRSCNVTESPYGRLNGSYPWPHQLPHQQYMPPTYNDPFLGYNMNWQLIPPKIRPFSSFTSQETLYGPSQLPHHHHLTSLDLRNDGFGRRYPRRRIILTRGGERVSFPISGGAPFISCCNCFELLKIPKRVTFSGKNNHKTIKCAVCSALISLRLEDNKIVASFSSSVTQRKVNKRKSNRSLHSSPDHDKCVYSFQLTDTEPNLTSNETEKREEPSFPVSILESQNEELTESQETDQERVIVDNNNNNNNNISIKDALVATDMDVSFTEYLNSDVSKENDQSRNKKVGTESFFTGLIKKRLRDFSRSSSVDKGKSAVFVNGQLLTSRAVKNAEKLAGPIQSGEYWYDSIAGFWGVMNQPCLGIIPPLIEEFDHPMPKNCAAGNTQVFVNGRELNQKDLNLLASRGLPTTKDRSYIIQISGKVVDEDTGEELEALGKLAPTVERVMHGFGMKVPKVGVK
ncbi:uncharacterized protein LOC143548725 [Bidens hawaiensis]|uniref:uncharacterized protein LOC143548725 n=1 Tax=Bidens hawaiensis TaxID=980011 RepID=UPI0040492164